MHNYTQNDQIVNIMLISFNIKSSHVSVLQ